MLIRFGLSTEPVTLDPRFATDAVSNRITDLIFARLVKFDKYYKPQGDLAEWRRIHPRLYRFKLKPERRDFHNGQRLTSSDVKASYLSVLDKKTASPHRASLSMIEEIRVPDPETIEFYLNKADPVFPGRLVLGIMPADLVSGNHPFHHSPVGSGPMEFMHWPRSGELQLKRLSDNQAIKFITVKDPTVRILKLKRGELDLLQNDIPREMLTWLIQQEEIAIEEKTGTVFSYLGFNLQDTVTSQHSIRLAIALALNRKEIIKYLFSGSARLANGLLIPEHWAGNPHLSGYRQSQEAAKNILRKLGYDQSTPLKISYKTSNDPFRIRVATAIQHQLKQVNIELTIESFDWGTFYADIKAGRFQMYSLSWVGLKLPDIFRNVFHSTSTPPAGANRGRYSDPYVDQLIEMAESSDVQQQQAEYYRQLQAYLLKQLPYIPLWYEDNILIRNKSIEDYPLNTDGDYSGLLTVKRPTGTIP